MKLRNKFALPPILGLFIIMTIFTFYDSLTEKSQKKSELNEKVEVFTTLIGMTNVDNIWNFDEEAMELNLDSFLKDIDILKIILKDENKRV